MKLTHLRNWSALSLAAMFVFGGAALAPGQKKQTPPPQTPAAQAEKGSPIAKIQTVAANNSNATKAIPDTLAEVNGVKITKNDILQEAFRQHYEKVLDARIRLLLIDMECQRQKITVSNQEIEDEIQRLAKSLNLTTENWLEMILNENGFPPDLYRSDVIRPLIQLRKLAGVRIQVTKEEMQKAYQAEYGPSVSLRQIVHNSRSELEKIRAAVVANPDSFAVEAKNSSTDPASAAYGGMIRPIRRYMTNEQIESVVFNLKPDEISQIVEWPEGNFILFQCVEHFPATQVDVAEAQKFLEMKIRDRKMQRVAGEVYAELHSQAQIQSMTKDKGFAEQNKKLAAIVNGVEITRLEVADGCLRMFGEIVLAERISIEILAQECQKKNITITEDDINLEIRDRASKEMPLLADGSPNVSEWLKLQSRNQQVSIEAFRANTLRPLVMLKQLCRDKVKITEEDIQKGFEANYGPRARCLAIFFNNMRQAQQIWDQVRKIQNEEYFGDLAAKYSIHGPSKALRGEIKPIQMHGGMPALEKIAFALQPGEISEVIQLGNEEYAILYGLGQTTPIVKNIADVRDMIVEDVFDKKLRLSMQGYLEDVLTRSTVTNFLTGETRVARQPAAETPVKR